MQKWIALTINTHVGLRDLASNPSARIFRRVIVIWDSQKMTILDRFTLFKANLAISDNFGEALLFKKMGNFEILLSPWLANAILKKMCLFMPVPQILKISLIHSWFLSSVTISGATALQTKIDNFCGSLCGLISKLSWKCFENDKAPWGKLSEQKIKNDIKILGGHADLEQIKTCKIFWLITEEVLG